MYDDDDESGSSSQGKIEFHDFLKSEGLRDDLLSATDQRHLLQMHQDEHAQNVKKQKDTREERKALKEGRLSATASAAASASYSAGNTSDYKQHKILAASSQFSGVDKKVSNVPTQLEANTNEALQDRLQNRLTPKPGFNPRPQYR